MKLSLALAALLCFTTWMSMVHATHGPIGNCLCPMLSKTRVKVERIVDYTNQSEGICPVAAIIFHTKTGKSLCSDPNSAWARRAKLKVDEERKKKTLKEMRQNEDESTSDVTPAASYASNNAPKRRGRHGRRRQRKKSRRGRKWLRKRA
ncbi:eotaxin-like [Chaetodon trifascialis]|uniref:eotaxin-like n=1 Tax=Chaetodon trifascialis TaxID=109706 RepID=UPI00399576F9